jgi:hypothetical protein
MPSPKASCAICGAHWRRDQIDRNASGAGIEPAPFAIESRPQTQPRSAHLKLGFSLPKFPLCSDIMGRGAPHVYYSEVQGVDHSLVGCISPLRTRFTVLR